MKKLLLETLDPNVDVDFLNSTSIYFYFPKDAPNDSGWCDASTGCRIISSSDSVIFITADEESELALRLRYGDRLRDTN